MPASRSLPAWGPRPLLLLLPLLLLSPWVSRPAWCYFSEERLADEGPARSPTLTVALLARNAAHSLPYALLGIERMAHPRDRTALWIATDHNVDNTTAMLEEWLSAVGHTYHHVAWTHKDQPRFYADEIGPRHWPSSRYDHVMRLRQMALMHARNRWSDFIFFVDADNVIVDSQIISFLISQNRTIVAPMMESRSAYSNFWCGITTQGYYKRTPEYPRIRERRKRGCFPVPMVHSTMLLDLRRARARHLTFYPPHPHYTWALDDIMAFAFSARKAEVPMYVCNQRVFGYLEVPTRPHLSHEDAVDNFVHAHLEIMLERGPLETSPHVYVPPRVPDKMGFDEMFVISLVRRADRRVRILRALHEQELKAKVIDAVDGRSLNTSQLRAMGVDMLPGYQDPYTGRDITRGEIGCFLSHYNVWTEVVERRMEKVVVFEDDVRFELFFKKRLLRLMTEVAAAGLEWDLIYLARKAMRNAEGDAPVQTPVRGLVRPGYSYWSLAYVLSGSGAKKLVEGRPLGRMMPVDEYLPLMSGTHPVEAYNAQFPTRDLRTFSASPLLAYPTHYSGEPGYFSDTETSTIWSGDATTDAQPQGRVRGGSRKTEGPSDGERGGGSRGRPQSRDAAPNGGSGPERGRGDADDLRKGHRRGDRDESDAGSGGVDGRREADEPVVAARTSNPAEDVAAQEADQDSVAAKGSGGSSENDGNIPGAQSLGGDVITGSSLPLPGTRDEL
ncbi:procollagen galactosyltransferase 1-like [Petromyzon marinus]|uniref:procollagen galactosyltransferase 1-like n=1 Tax=Petromyzon marinus TaxID=7757 RepID=UPI003F6F1B2E